MKFYSEELKQLFNTEEELNAAEQATKDKLSKAEEIKVAIKERFDDICKSIECLYNDLEDLDNYVDNDEVLDFMLSMLPAISKMFVKFKIY